jgi:hypothetical protein
MARRRRRLVLRLRGRPAQLTAALFGVAVLGAIIVGCVIQSRTRSPEPLPERFKPSRLSKLDRIEGWVPSWADEARVVAESAEAGFTDLLFFHGTVDERGAVTLEDPAGLEKGRVAAVLNAQRTWLTVTNHGKSLAGALNDARLEAHARSLAAAFDQSRCQHIDLDYENLSSAQARLLPALAELLASRLERGTRVSFTLQPVDSVHRPSHTDAIRQLLETDAVYTVRFMMYDYHWSGSLPGALCPMDSYRRLIEHWPRHAHKLTMCLPLYGYDWPRPEDTSLPKGASVTMRDVAGLSDRRGFEAVWMQRESELACRYDGHMVALPSFRAITRRVELALENGVPAVSFWHLGCGKLASVTQACERGADVTELVSHGEIESWDEWLLPYKRKVCKVMKGDGRTLEEYAQAHGVSRAAMYRFNEHIERDTAGKEVFVPKTE